MAGDSHFLPPGQMQKLLNDRLELTDNIGNTVEYIIAEPRPSVYDHGPSYLIVGATRSLAGLGKNFMADAESIDFQTCYIESHLLGLLKLTKLSTLFRTYEKNLSLLSGILIGDDYLEMEIQCNTLSRALDIIVKYYDKTKPDILRCQEELMDNGLKQYARL